MVAPGDPERRAEPGLQRRARRAGADVAVAQGPAERGRAARSRRGPRARSGARAVLDLWERDAQVLERSALRRPAVRHGGQGAPDHVVRDGPRLHLLARVLARRADAEEQARRRRVRARRAQAGRRGGAGGVRPGRRAARREAVPDLDPGGRADERSGRAGRVRVGGRRALRPRGRPTPDRRPSGVREAARPGAATGAQVDHRAGHAVAGRGKPGERIAVEFADGSRWPAEQGEVPPTLRTT